MSSLLNFSKEKANSFEEIIKKQALISYQKEKKKKNTILYT